MTVIDAKELFRKLKADTIRQRIREKVERERKEKKDESAYNKRRHED